MAGEKKVSIKIETKADTKGAKDASAEVNKLVAAEKQLDTTSDQATNSIAGMRSEIDRLSSQLERAEVNSEEFVATARQLDLAQSRLDTTLKTTGTGFKNVGMLIGQAGFQVQDFAVQVGGGTSALTAFAQQGSQLLGMFGPGGAVAGALLAIGAIGVKVFSSMGEEASKFITDFEQAAKNAADNISEDFDKIIEDVDKTSERAKLLAGQYDGIKDASDKYSQSALENAEKQRHALIIISELLGRQRDLLTELREAQQGESDKRNLSTTQDINAQNERITKAQEVVKARETEVARQEDVRAKIDSQLTLEIQKLETLRDQKRVLEEVVRNRPTALENLALAEGGGGGVELIQRAQAAHSADKALAGDGGINAEILAAGAAIDTLRGKLTDYQKVIDGTLVEVERAQVAVTNVTSQATIEIAKITEAAQSSEVLAVAQNAKATIATGNTQLVDLLKGVLAEAAPANEAQKKVFDLVTENLKDGIVTAEDTKKVAELVKADSISTQDAARGALLASETQKAARQTIETAINDLSINAEDASKIAGALPNLMKALSGLNQKSLEQIGVILNLLSIHTQNLNGIDVRLRQVELEIENSPGR